METLINNWYWIGGAIVLVAVLAGAGYRFLRLPMEERKKKVKGWLLYAVTVAEKEMGGGTGKQKLQYVYGLAVDKFPWVDELIPFETFSGWVDEALETLRGQLEVNAKVAEFVNH